MKPYLACNLLAVAKPREVLLVGPARLLQAFFMRMRGEAAAIETARILATAGPDALS